MNKVVKLIISIGSPLLVGFIASFFTSESVKGWYQTIQKPSFNPPSWVFGPVWTVLYIMMGIALYLVWNQPRSPQRDKAITFFILQLILNGAWSFIFFYAQKPGWAFVEIIILWLMIIITMISFKPFSKTSFYLMIPYLLWVSFASLLTYSIWNLNS